jgi:hypothetical protein
LAVTCMSFHDEQSEQDRVPRITLRIPGPWKSLEQLRIALAKADAGYIIPKSEPDAESAPKPTHESTPASPGEIYLVHQHSGQKFALSIMQRDDEIIELFADSGRMKSHELRALENHQVKVFVTGPGGSHEAARTFLAIGKAFIKAGALGVMVDNSGNCHGPSDWLDLARDKQMGGMYWAFVAVTASKEEVFSAGMHCLGFRDAELLDPIDPKSSGMMMHEFLGYTYQSGIPIADGDPIGGPDGPEFILRHVECIRFPKDSPWHNPYGVWRLEKFEDEGIDV